MLKFGNGALNSDTNRSTTQAKLAVQSVQNQSESFPPSLETYLGPWKSDPDVSGQSRSATGSSVSL